MKHSVAEDETRELAALYALGALTQHEARAFENHLSEGCEACAVELREFEGTVEHLAWATATVKPPAEIGERLLARVAAEPRARKEAGAEQRADAPSAAAQESGAAPTTAAPPRRQSGAAQAAPLIVRADDGVWQETENPGVFAKVLFFDRESATVTTLVRMQPGARIPAHRHRGVEQCLVLEGDVSAGGVTLSAGDYNCSLRDSVHEELTTEGGNLLLLVSPESYEVLERRTS